eukprot:CAMPEP_0184714772 /NCGR_PEP_ID=MMETSP0314-20130426/4828_1 /TAXON_ID=38298 /ORGANISM="Rhodella maculata, Strain CCMP 736" /LENGTH=38 /DNA_ID= /DNA_START= /DNA_END= /DNA_ORIENTATION=
MVGEGEIEVVGAMCGGWGGAGGAGKAGADGVEDSHWDG